MAFPDKTDRGLIAHAERVDQLATELADWVAEHNPARQKQDMAPVAESDDFELTRLRRLASSLYSSAKTPVSAAVYGPSQVGKSLFVGRVLQPRSDDISPLGKDEQLGEPAYYRHLSFDIDLNPQSGSNEATALVTRFTTKDRLVVDAAPEFPVMVRALTRAQWLRVMARGFMVECQTPERFWSPEQLEELFVDLSKSHRETQVDRRWRFDLLDAYAYMRKCDVRGFRADEAVLGGLLSRFPLTNDGYVELAASLFWNHWRSLTGLFVKVHDFLEKIETPGRDPAILTHWAGVRFLLDSQRSKSHERRTSRVFSRVDWDDFRMSTRDGWHVLEYRPNQGGAHEPIEIIQAGMLELVIPILPHRISDDWRKVIEQIDILDVPGMRAGRQGAEGGKRVAADTLDEQMEIVKRGKVAYLFERYTEDLQIQTLLLLARGGNLEVTAQMKAHIDAWGAARYGDAWPSKVRDAVPALFLGVTGIDEEFRNRAEYADSMLYETRLAQLADALGEVMTDFGGRGQPFTNVFPIRYPGTWDASSQEVSQEGADRWERAREAFLGSSLVARHVSSPTEKWEAAITDNDGGLSLISRGWREATTAEAKQDQLAAHIAEVEGRLCQLAQGWVVDPDVNLDRQKRIDCAARVLTWLDDNKEAVYDRVHGLEQALGFAEGAQWRLSDLADMPSRGGVGRPDSLEGRFRTQLREFLHEWATVSAPQQWEEHASSHPHGEPWLSRDDFTALTRYLRDYLCSESVFEDICSRLLLVAGLRLRDEAAKVRARRKYMRIMLNDFVLNPGPSCRTLGEANGSDDDLEEFGLMKPFIRRWRRRLPEALALGAGTEVRIPPGNSELVEALRRNDI